MYTICQQDDLIDVEEVDDIVKHDKEELFQLKGTVTESVSGEKFKLEFDDYVISNVQKVFHSIKQCIRKSDHCRRLKEILLDTKENVITIDISIQEQEGKYLVYKIFVNGQDTISKRKRVRRAFGCNCPRGFICHGCTNITRTTMLSSMMSKRSFPLCQTNDNCNDNNKPMESKQSFVINFKVHQSNEGVKENLKKSEEKSTHGFKGINIKHVFGTTSINRRRTRRSTMGISVDNLMNTLKKAFKLIRRNLDM